MTKHARKPALLLSLLLASQPLWAEEISTAKEPTPDWTFPTSISFVSDYIFRGQSQTWGKPAVQFSVEADHVSGFYGGFFMSNVSDQWLPGAHVETDLYAGFRGALPGSAADVGYDVGAIYYAYPGANWDESGFNPPRFPAGTTKSNSLNTGEVYASLSYGWLSVKSGITVTEYFGWNTNNSGLVFGFNGNPNAGVTGNTRGSYYFEVNGSKEVFPTWTVSGQLGRQIINNSRGLDITYYKAGVTKALPAGFSLGVFYSGSNMPDAYRDFLSLRNTTSKSDITEHIFFVNIAKSF